MAALLLRLNNPYHYGRIVDFKDGQLSLDRTLLNIPNSPLDRIYIIKSGDELSVLAHRFYGDSKYWWILADKNKLENPFILEEGTTLIIPDLIIAQISVP